MSLIGSMIVAAQTMWSSGVGASVGLEAGYTQIASGIASRIGNAFRLRRGDLRILVGCGAAAGIAGAFGAPLAGAFYGFELIIGSYSPTSLAPVGIAALIGFLVAQRFSPAELGVVAPERRRSRSTTCVLAATLGLLAAMLGIILMRGVAICEAMFTRLRLRPTLRTMAGGMVVGLFAIVSPQVMSSGHGALRVAGMLDLSFRAVALLFVLKIVASIASLGSGFRGGLFFSSLLIGALGGHLLAIALTMFWPTDYFDPNAYAVIGMSALAASVIGGPLTMIFIALETTGDLWLTTAVLIAVIITLMTTSVQLVDLAGNAANVAGPSFVIDTIVPSFSALTVTGGYTGASGAVFSECGTVAPVPSECAQPPGAVSNNQVSVSFTTNKLLTTTETPPQLTALVGSNPMTCQFSGSQALFHYTCSYTVSTSDQTGQHTVTVMATDEAGNQAVPATASIAFDLTPLVLTESVQPNPATAMQTPVSTVTSNKALLTAPAVSVSPVGTVSGALGAPVISPSGVSAYWTYSYSSPTQPLAGQFTFTASATDSTGHVASVVAPTPGGSATAVTIDNVVPVISGLATTGGASNLGQVFSECGAVGADPRRV